MARTRTLPTIGDLSLLPDHISPNFDAPSDVTHMTFSARQAGDGVGLSRQHVELWTAQRVWTGEEAKTAAGEQSLDLGRHGQRSARAEWQVHARHSRARHAGNIVESGQPLVVEDSGVPEASIVSAHIGPLQIIRGDEVCLDAIVRNTGQTVLRTEGPDPGYVYNSLDSFARSKTTPMPSTPDSGASA